MQVINFPFQTDLRRFFRFLDLDGLLTLSRVNKQWRDTVKSHLLVWRYLGKKLHISDSDRDKIIKRFRSFHAQIAKRFVGKATIGAAGKCYFTIRRYLTLEKAKDSLVAWETIAEISTYSKLIIEINSYDDLINKIVDFKKWIELNKAKLNKINYLNLSSKSFCHIPHESFECESLIKLDLADNQISTIPKEITTLQSLKQLHLSKNAFEKFPKEVINLENLHTLDLCSNKLKKLPNIDQLQKIQWLFLSRNQFVTFPKEITRLPCLKILDLSYNQIKEVSQRINELRSLEILNLFNNQIKKLPKELTELKRLISLNVGKNPIQLYPKALDDNYDLKIIGLNDG